MLLIEKRDSLSDLLNEVKAYFKKQGYAKAIDEGKASYTDPELSRANMFLGEEGKLIRQHCGEN